MRAFDLMRHGKSSLRSDRCAMDIERPQRSGIHPLASAGAELRFANGVALIAKFDGEFASHSQTYAGTGTVRWTW